MRLTVAHTMAIDSLQFQLQCRYPKWTLKLMSLFRPLHAIIRVSKPLYYRQFSCHVPSSQAFLVIWALSPLKREP